ncbi:MAG: threonine/serine exporter family protein, partial [Enterococcus sp.]|nr:threonine/serine exporter family protein [Enterococcus sp.]
IAALGIGIAAVLAVHFGFAHSVDNLIIGSVMPLVPGVAITTSFRDILAGHLISGLVRGTEAIIVASAIGVGIATALILLGGIL